MLDSWICDTYGTYDSFRFVSTIVTGAHAILNAYHLEYAMRLCVNRHVVLATQSEA